MSHLSEDARSRFASNKAMFEAKCQTDNFLPSFYSPRLQRSSSSNSNNRVIQPSPTPARHIRPLPPGRNAAAHSVLAAKKQSNAMQGALGSPMSQAVQNFSQLASDLEWMSRHSSEGSKTLPLLHSLHDDKHSPTSSSEEDHHDSSPHQNDTKPQDTNFEPYWRTASFIRRKTGGSAEQDMPSVELQEKGKMASGSESSVASSSVPSEPRHKNPLQPETPVGGTTPKMLNFLTNGDGSETGSRTLGSSVSPVETLRGLSPLHDPGRRIKFSTAPIPVYKTWGTEYDRRNDEIDPISSCAEYELERRLEKMELFDVELDKGADGLGIAIIGMGVGADEGLEKLGIFIKSITPGGAVDRDSRIRVCDQIVAVDGVSLVGVSQYFAAQVLRAATGPKVLFTIGREADLENSEVAALIRKSLASGPSFYTSSSSSAGHPPPSHLFNLHHRNQSSADNSSIASSAIPGIQERWLKRSPSHDSSPPPAPPAPSEPATPRPFCNYNNLAPPAIPYPSSIIAPWRSHISSSSDRSHSAAAATPQRQEIVDFRLPKQQADTSREVMIPPEVYETQIKSRIVTLESELNESKRKTDQMTSVLENTRHHYAQLEARFNQARDIVRTFQEREREMLMREANHVEQIRDLTAEYTQMVDQMRSRIEELEIKLDQMSRHRTSVVEGELSELREKLAQSERNRSVHSFAHQNSHRNSEIQTTVPAEEKANVAEFEEHASPPPPHAAPFPTEQFHNNNVHERYERARQESAVSSVHNRVGGEQQRPLTPPRRRQIHHDNNNMPKEKLSTAEEGKPREIEPIEQQNNKQRPLPTGRHGGEAQNDSQQQQPIPHQRQISSNSTSSHQQAARHVGITSHLVPLSTASSAPSSRQPAGGFTCVQLDNGLSRQLFNGREFFSHDAAAAGFMPASGCIQLQHAASLPSKHRDACNQLSPIPVISEPNSPALPHKFLKNGNVANARMLFPYLRKRYFQAENEFWRENIESQGLQVLSWNVDEVCQLLMHMGLEKYIPEFMINTVDGPKLLILDGSKLKAIGVFNHHDRAIIKKRIKMIKNRIERERKLIEKEARARNAAIKFMPVQ